MMDKTGWHAGLGMMTEFISDGLRLNTNELLKLLARFDYATFNKVPIGGGWSTGAIAEHLLLTDIRIGKVLIGKTETIERDSQDRISSIVERFRDNPDKIQASSFLYPSDVAKDPISLSEKILQERRKIVNIALQFNPNLTYPDAPHHDLGVLSGIEWINFLIFHTKRHMLQMEKMLA